MKYLRLEVLKLRKKTRSWLGPILVFWLIMLAYPLTIEVSPKNLEIGFFSVLWIAILLSMMFATEDIFTEDYNDGSLEQSLISETSFSYLVGLRVLIHWLLIGIPISLLGFVFSLGTTENLINYSGFIFLLLGSLSIIIVTVPIVVSFIIKAHLE